MSISLSVSDAEAGLLPDASQILLQIEGGLKMLSSREFQERVWLRGEGPEVSSYEELICHPFDDLGFSQLVMSDWSGFNLNEEQKAALVRFDTRVSAFNAAMPDLSSPEFAIGMLDRSDVRHLATDPLHAVQTAQPNKLNFSSATTGADPDRIATT